MGALNCKNCKNQSANEKTEVQFDNNNIENENNIINNINNGNDINNKDKKNIIIEDENYETLYGEKNDKLKGGKNIINDQLTTEGHETNRDDKRKNITSLNDEKIGKIEINDDKDIKTQLGIIEEINIVKTDDGNYNEIIKSIPIQTEINITNENKKDIQKNETKTIQNNIKNNNNNSDIKNNNKNNNNSNNNNINNYNNNNINNKNKENIQIKNSQIHLKDKFSKEKNIEMNSQNVSSIAP